MEVSLSTANNFSMYNNANDSSSENAKDKDDETKALQNALADSRANREKEQRGKLQTIGQDQNQEETFKVKLLDDKANRILDSLLSDKLEGEKIAIKSMLEQSLSGDEEIVGKERLLRRLDEFIQDKKDGLNVDPYGIINLANALKTLYESDFEPLDIAV